MATEQSTEQQTLWDTGEPGKACTKCKKWKLFTEFRKRYIRQSHGRRVLKYEWWCIKCIGEATRDWERRNPRKARERRVASNKKVNLQRLGLKKPLTMEEYEALVKQHNNLCAICKRPSSHRNYKTGSIVALAVDHDHKTGQLRGLLCMGCNQGLGMFLENTDTLRAAIAYLEQYATGVA